MFLTRIFSISSVLVMLKRLSRPRHAPSSFWKSAWCRIRLICSDSLRSIAAIMSSIVLIVSLPISWVCAKACCARVCTACSTALRASSLLGLNSFCSSDARSLPSRVTEANAELVWVSAMGILRVVCAWIAGSGAAGLVGGLGGAGQRPQQRRIGEHLRDQLLGAALAVHVGDEVLQLLARGEQLVQRVDLARDRRGREVVHAVEGDVDVEVAQ